MSPQLAKTKSTADFLRATRSYVPLIIAALVVMVLMGFTTWAMMWSITQQVRDSDQGAYTALQENPVNEAAAIVYARLKSASIVKTSSLFLSFLMVLLGSGFVLLPVRSAYIAHLEGREVKGTLSSSSPGLIIVTLGVVLAVAALYVKADFSYEENAPSVTAAQADTTSSRTDYSPWPALKEQK